MGVARDHVKGEIRLNIRSRQSSDEVALKRIEEINNQNVSSIIINTNEDE